MKTKPAWAKADHGAESAFMFGGPFLMDERSLLGMDRQTDMQSLGSRAPRFQGGLVGTAAETLRSPPGPF